MDEGGTTPMYKAEALLKLMQNMKSFEYVTKDMEATQEHTTAVMAEVDRQIAAVEQALGNLASARRDLEGLRQAQARTVATALTWYGHTQNEITEAVAMLMAESGERWDRLRREGKL